jgi:hypothetical protein
MVFPLVFFLLLFAISKAIRFENGRRPPDRRRNQTAFFRNHFALTRICRRRQQQERLHGVSQSDDGELDIAAISDLLRTELTYIKTILRLVPGFALQNVPDFWSLQRKIAWSENFPTEPS